MPCRRVGATRPSATPSTPTTWTLLAPLMIGDPPIGIANAANPDRAYAEAIDVAGAHQFSNGREAAGVFAAAVAAAFTPGAGVADVVDTALRVAHDGTH